MRPAGPVLRRLVAIMAIGIVAAACGGDSNPSQPTTSDTPTTAAPAPATTPPTSSSSSTTVAESTTTTTTTTTTTIVEAIDAAALLDAYCTVCHGTELEGGVGPALAAAGHAGDHGSEELIGVIANGRGEMPSWSAVLTAEEIAEIVSFIEELQEHE